MQTSDQERLRQIDQELGRTAMQTRDLLAERDAIIARLAAAGHSYADIAEWAGLRKQRVGQILNVRRERTKR